MAASKYEFDDTRSAIGANDLSDEERRAMLGKFKEIGGKVLSERELRAQQNTAEKNSKGNESSTGAAGSRRGAGGGPIRDVKLPSQMAREKNRNESDRKTRQREEWERTLKRYGSTSAKFFIRLRCAMNGLTSFGNDLVKAKFLGFLALDLRQALVEFNLIGNDLFLQKTSVAKAISKDLDNKTPIYLEVLQYSHDLFKEPSLNRMIEKINESSGQAISLKTLEEDIKDLYRALYYLFPFQETLRKAINAAADIFVKENGQAVEVQMLEQKIKKLNKNIRNVFGIAFPRLFMLICRADNMDYPAFSPFFEKAMNIQNDKKLGRRKKGEATNISETPEADATEDENSGDQMEVAAEEGEEKVIEEGTSEEVKPAADNNPLHSTKEYQYGVRLMSILNPPEFRRKHDPQNTYQILGINDKVLLSYMFFKEFDMEYSFVMTTNKIKMAVDYGSGVKVDHKKNLMDLYDRSRDIFKAIDLYHDARKELKKVKTSAVSSNYVEQSKAEAKAAAVADTEGRNARTLLRRFFDDTYQSLAKLIADMKGPKLIVENPEDTVEFQKGVEGVKRLNGKKVKDCILEAYCYALAFRERLSEGDLFGGNLEMTDEEMKSSFGSNFK